MQSIKTRFGKLGGIGMDRHGVRYQFEHRILPQLFFEDKAQFIGIILNDKDVLFRVIDEIFSGEEVTNPYSKDDFTIEAARIAESVMMLKIIFPEPEEEPLCYCSYLFFNEKFEKLGYYCIEKGNEEGEFYPFVCSWTPEGEHVNHGNCTFEDYNDFFRCADIFMEKEFGLSRKPQISD